MQNLPFFSIVMPVYNVEEHLSQAVESVLAQTFSDFELILVDDCSPDNSGTLCDTFCQQDSRISVVHLAENGGVSNARNIGQKKAVGQYLMFMDSDDTVTDGLLADVHRFLSEHPADVVVFGMSEDLYTADGKLIRQKTVSAGSHIFTEQAQARAFVMELEKSTLYGYACNKFYSRAILAELNLLYEEYALLEDLFFNIAYFQEIQSLIVLEKTYYHYRKVMDTRSRTAKFVPEYFDLHTEKIRRLLQQQVSWNLLSSDVQRTLADLYARYIFSALQRNFDSRSQYSKRERKQWIITLFQSDLFCSLHPYLSVNLSFQGVLHFFLRKKNVTACLFLGKLLFIIKERFPRLFNRVK